MHHNITDEIVTIKLKIRHVLKGLIASKLAELGFESVSKDFKALTGSHNYRNQGRIFGGSDIFIHL